MINNSKEKKRTLRILGGLLLFLVCFLIQTTMTQAAPKLPNKNAKSKTYTVTSSSKPYQNKYVKSTTYNKYTKQYYMLRSYLEQMELNGGGTLVLKKGTYTLTNVLYIPSNVTIKLLNGVKINKSMKTGTKKLSPSKSMFQLVAPSQAKVKDACIGYSGSQNVKIIGQGSARIDLKYVINVVGIVIGHNNSVTIDGITFQNMKGGNFIQLAASKKITISNNVFRNHKDTASNNKEAIRLAVADLVTNNFSYKWSMKDSTVNKDIYIKNNQFKKLERAIGSTKYVENKYHANVQILGNAIDTIDSDAIRVLNWSAPSIRNNTISNVADGINNKRAIVVSGGLYPVITNNTFVKVARSIQILPEKNTGAGNAYLTTYNTISSANAKAMVKNTVQEVDKYYIIYNRTYGEYTKNSSRWYYVDYSTKDYMIVEDAPTYREYFTDYSTYNETAPSATTDSTKDYYVFRSYLEQLERVGGGTLTIKKGTYIITNTLYIPSNVTVYMEDGVVIKKGSKTGLSSLPPARSIFQMVPPSKAMSKASIGGYNGGHNIHIIASGTVLIDLDHYLDSLAFVLGHNKNISISGITFENMNGCHFIELNSSDNVTVEGCSFSHHWDSLYNNKEAINIDNPDAETKGFNQIWAKQDCTPAKNVYIKNNTFTDLERAVGTHKYTQGAYHENVQILNNVMKDCDKDPIRVLNWKDPIISGNTIEDVNDGLGSYRAILMSGVSNPTVSNNTFILVARPIEVMPWKNGSYGGIYEITYNTLSQENIDTMTKNTLVNVGESFIRISNVYGETLTMEEKNQQKYYIKN